MILSWFVHALAFRTLAGNVAQCLVDSDRKRNTGFDGASTGWTSWIDDAAAVRLQSCFEAIGLAEFAEASLEGDELRRWLRWMQHSPSPMLCDLTESFRQIVNETLHDETLLEIETTRDAFLARMGCRMIVLPSGSSLPHNLRTAPGAMVYGKLLLGGVTRFRVIGKTARRAGERRAVVMRGEPLPTWLQYGGPERNYQAVDMGSCVLMELMLLPSGLELDPTDPSREMTINSMGLDLDALLSFEVTSDSPESDEGTPPNGDPTANLNSGYFQQSIGGLQPQIDEIVRRVLDGRVVRSANDGTPLETVDDVRRQEMSALLDLGLTPVKGLLLYGPPGCGKTLFARQVSRVLDARPPKIVAAPELLDRWVGGSEKLIRELFVDAEEELCACNGDPTMSALHVIVIDECDAVFRKRSSAEGVSEVTRASAVNQILSKLDGIQSLGNVLLIGMTNRRELLDPALLRPGRLEVQIEIPLPKKEDRREILQIHFGPLRQRGRLSRPLCEAIDGGTGWGRSSDLASETEGFSGADIAGLVRCSGSLALDRTRRQGSSGLADLLITLEDVAEALKEVRS